MCSSSSTVVIHHAGHGHTDQSAVTPTLPGMPPEITDHILSFTPDSARACRAVSKALRQMGEGTLQELAERVTGLSSDSSLYALIQSRFASFSLHLQSHPNSSCLQFHLSLSEGIVSLGALQRPNRILSLQEIGQCNNRHQDINLQRIWGSLFEQIMTMGPEPAGIPNVNASAQQIRSWMRADANQPALQRITDLRLSIRALTCVPMEIRLCTALQVLNLETNQIDTLPANVFQGLTSLQWLFLSSNQIASVPANVFQGLTSLQSLDLSGNQIASLPATVFQGLASLRTLYLGSNQIASLPATVFQGLTSLQMLNLSGNQIASLTENVFQGLTSLQELFLRSNQIATLTENVFQNLTSLRELDLVGNQIASVPATVFQGLTSLQKLYLCHNQIATLTETVFQGLTFLRKLYLNSNKITSLPATVFQGLTSLQWLFLHSNKITSLPATVFQGLISLQKLYLYDNPQLLISYKNLNNDSNNIEFPNMMRAFFNYTCQSPFAGLYQLAAGAGSREAVRESFSGVPSNIKNAIYDTLWVEARHPNTRDPQWGKHHTFDDMPIFCGALKRYVRESFEGLSGDQKIAVYGHVSDLARGEGVDVDRVPGWGERHACDNILRLIDAMMHRLESAQLCAIL